MRVQVVFIVLLTTTALPASAGENRLTLDEAYRMALTRSETLAIREEEIRIAEAHYLQALGTVLPHVSVQVTELIQDVPAAANGETDIGRTFTRRSRPEVAIQWTQPLFQGFREFRALKVSRAEKARNSLQRDRARQLLFSDVARAYFTVLELERELRIQRSIRETLILRVKEIRERIELGKSRESELLTTESQLASVEAEIEKSRGLILTARDLLGFLIGEPTNRPLVDEFKIPSALPPFENYLSRFQDRPDLGAAQESVRLAKGQLDYEKGGRTPTLDLEANYYPYRVGFLSDINWDLLLTLKIPIFQGGATRGKIREAAHKFKQSELTRDEANRRAELEVRQATHALKASRAREAALRRAEAKASANYQSQVEEYRLGLVNNLEVLQSLRDWQERRIESNRSHYQAKLDYLQLLVAAGDLPRGETP